jgi:hypothetical protein
MRKQRPVTITGELSFIREGDEFFVYLTLAGRPLAKRRGGESWIMLDPRYKVTGGEPGDYDTITIEPVPGELRSNSDEA